MQDNIVIFTSKPNLR